MFEKVCHSRWNPLYLIIAIPIGIGQGYPELFEIARIGDEGTVRIWGTCIRAAIDAEDVQNLLSDMVQKISDGDAKRVNNLGMSRLDGTVFPCGKGEPTPYSDGYCGIALGEYDVLYRVGIIIVALHNR